MNLDRCPSCLKPHGDGYCLPCRRRLFQGLKVSPYLELSLPEFNTRGRGAAARISISGVQPKYSLKLEGRVLTFTEHGGQYILKPAAAGSFDHMEAMPANEHVTMQIARQVFRMPVAECALVFLSDNAAPCYLTRRFDVLPDGTHQLQEDFAQIAQVSPLTHGQNFKYDFSYQKIAELMKATLSAYALEVEFFFRLILYNYLIHNGDAHIKNFSVFRDNKTGLSRLTPAYDLLNTRLHLPNESAMALDLFEDDYVTESYEINGFFAYNDFYEFGGKLGIPPKRIVRFLNDVVDHESEVHTLLDRSFLSQELIVQYKDQVADRLRALRSPYRGGC